jgi:threonine dehydrogenase-like Zn-dependent dehydrogenase
VRELREPRLLLHCFVANGSFDPISVLTQREPITNAIEAYQSFDAREPGWIKVKLEP